ncbi:MAG: hypothetical protein QNK34_11635 [Woeseiaceae bacterium]|nr:hypothetical protein [Woeseiaceae bacterium]
MFATKSDRGLVSVHLANAEGVEKHAVQSSASDAIKWALGWMSDEDVVVLQSSDIGTTAYDIVDNRLVPRVDAFKIEEIQARAEELYAERYQ